MNNNCAHNMKWKEISLSVHAVQVKVLSSYTIIHNKQHADPV